MKYWRSDSHDMWFCSDRCIERPWVVIMRFSLSTPHSVNRLLSEWGLRRILGMDPRLACILGAPKSLAWKKTQAGSRRRNGCVSTEIESVVFDVYDPSHEPGWSQSPLFNKMVRHVRHLSNLSVKRRGGEEGYDYLYAATQYWRVCSTLDAQLPSRAVRAINKT